MAKESKHLTAFITHNGLYQFNMILFGLVNSAAAATLSRVMRKLLKGMNGVQNYIDDILIHTQTWDEHMNRLREVSQRLRRENLTARPSKCNVGYTEVEFFGHQVGKSTIKPREQKVQAILKSERP